MKSRRIGPFSVSLVRKAATALVVGAIVFFFAYGILHNWHEIAQYEWRPDYASLLFSFVAYSVGLVFAIMCWDSVINRLGGNSSLSKNIKFYCYTNLAKRLPTPIWYVAARVYVYDREGIAKHVTSTAVLIETVVMIFSGILVYLVSLPFSPNASPLAGNLWVLLLLIFLAVIMARPSWLGVGLNFLLTKLGRDKLSIVITPGDMLRWSALFSLAWILGGFLIYFLANGIYPLASTHLPAMINIWAMSGIAGQVALFMPAGAGVKEATLAYLLSHYMPLPVAIVISLLSRLWLMIIDFFWALVLSRL